MAGGLKESVTYRDAKGNTGRVSFYVASTGTVASEQLAANTVVNSIAALTNALEQSRTGPGTSVAGLVTYGTNAEFPSIEDKAVFTFADANGGLHRFQIPAPKLAIFDADGETVDKTQADVVTFTSALVANAVNRNGIAIGFFVGGIRIRRKLHRKLTIFVLDPSLNEPAE
jgi:hypothetical protein